MKDILVSIVIPVYNSERSLPKCLDSLIGQTYKNIEIICVNDCSKDCSKAVIEAYHAKDSRVKLIDHKENKNAGGTRNDGIKAAKGHYICLVDNDDWMAFNAIESLVAASLEGKEDLVVGDWINYYSSDKYTIVANYPNKDDSKAFTDFICRKGFRLLGCLIKRSIFFEFDLFFPERIFYEDNAIGIPLLLCCENRAHVNIPLYYYSNSIDSVTGFTTFKKTEDRFHTTNMLEYNLRRLGFITAENKELINYLFIRLNCQTLNMLSMIHSLKSFRLANLVCKKLSKLNPNIYSSELDGFFQRINRHPYWSYILLSIRQFLSKIKVR
ncbi:MAG: glycosyltransferase family 2 protein [Bacteroidales bacterium]|nr:glycosyltransferase family 2 protein [Bacteroidales bacterium]